MNDTDLIIPVPDLTITSFGYNHRDQSGAFLLAPRADFTFDVSKRFRDPHIDPELRNLTGLDQAVYDKVMSTPGALDYVAEIGLFLVNLVDEQVIDCPITVAFGCVGGRHRSVAMTRMLAEEMDDYNWSVQIEHRDVHKPVLARASDRESK